MKLISYVPRRVPQTFFFFLFLFFLLICWPHSIWADTEDERLDVKLISHRGLTTPFPENSLEAIQAMVQKSRFETTDNHRWTQINDR